MLKSALKNSFSLSKNQRKLFSLINTAGSPHSQNLAESGSCPFLTEENKKTISKLIERDYQYFVNMSEKTGIANILTTLNDIASQCDPNSARGREILTAKEEAVTRITYNERSIEEHESHSISICEKDLYRTYRIHLQELETKAERRTATLRARSNEFEQVLFIKTGSPIQQYQHFISPSLIFLVPSWFILTNKALLKLTLGSYSPFLLALPFAYAAYSRYSWLTASNQISKENYVVSSLSIQNGNVLNINTHSLTGNRNFSVNLNNASIQKRENDFRRNHYYVITDEVTNNKFVILVDEDSQIDERALTFLSLKKYTEKDIYDVKTLILTGNNLIDFDLSSKTSSSVDTLARISILSQEKGDISNLSQEELYKHISNIPDSKVQEYLVNLQGSINSTLPKQEALIVEISDFFQGLGLKLEEAQQITKILVTSLYVKNINDLKTISDQNYTEIFLQVNPEFNSTYPNFLASLKLYFN